MGSLAEQSVAAERDLPAAKEASRVSPDMLLFTGLLLASLAPIWWFRYFPSQDGPAHLENAAILREYHDPQRSLLRIFYEINAQPEPNWLGHLLLAGLMAFVPPLVAEKILLSGYLLLLPLSLRYALKSVRGQSGFLTLLIFPFVPNLFFHMGFYNFCYSLPLLFFVVGYWLRHEGEFTPVRILVLLLLGVILYFGHLVSLMAAWVVIGIQVLWQAWLVSKPGISGFWSALWPRLRVLLAAFLPTLLLALWFLARQGWAARPAESFEGSTWSILLKLEALVSYSVSEALVSVVVFAGFVALSGYLVAARLKRSGASSSDGLLLAAAAFVFLYFLTPSALSGGLFVNFRLTLYPFFTLMLWFATQPAIHALRWAVRTGACLTTLGLLGLHAHTYALANAYMDDLLGIAEAIEPDHTLLALNYSPAGIGSDGKALSSRVGPFRHAAGHLAVSRHVVNLANYEATTGYFPILYRPDVNPYLHMGKDEQVLDHGLHTVPPRVDLLEYQKSTGQPVDYIVIWGLRADQQSWPWTQNVLRQIEQGGYEPLSASDPASRAQLFRRKRMK